MLRSSTTGGPDIIRRDRRSTESSARTSDDDRPEQSSSAASPTGVNGKDFADHLPAKSADVALRNMTVTTETVTSIPQASIATAERGGAGKAEAAGTLRTKKSNDTIRPKKERKRSSKKPASVNAASCTCTPLSDCVSCVIQHQTVKIKYMASHAMRFDESHDLQCKAGRDFGSTDSLGSLPSASPASSRFHAFRALRTMCSYTNLRTREASTRADVFEDRVKNAMEEATSDDSDETFVYESNPPENQNPAQQAPLAHPQRGESCQHDGKGHHAEHC
jgi:hypothetical protein